MNPYCIEILNVVGALQQLNVLTCSEKSSFLVHDVQTLLMHMVLIFYREHKMRMTARPVVIIGV